MTAPPKQYDVGPELGRGAMGTVHLAKDLDLRRSVAYKVTNDEVRNDPDMAKRFLAEVQITAQLEHPNVVPVYALARDASGLAYTMRVVRGRTLAGLLDEAMEQHKAGEVDAEHGLRARLDVFLKVCDAMAFAHSRGVVHRDLKPANIMLGTYGEAYVMDWGVATLVATPAEEKVSAEGTLEGENLAIGTPAYMSPEQARGEALDGRSDQYALGLLLAEIMTLQRPASSSVMTKLQAAQEGRRPPTVHAYGEPLPRELVAIADKAASFRAEDRYDDVRALAADVRRYLRGEAVLASPDTALQALARLLVRHRERVAVGAMGLVALALLAMAGVTVQTLRHQGVARDHARLKEMELEGRVASAGNVIDREFAQMSDTMELLGGIAVDLVETPGTLGGRELPASRFDIPGQGPADLQPAPKLGGTPISIEESSFFVPPDASEQEKERVRRLGAITPHLRHAVLLSYSVDDVDDDLEKTGEIVRTRGAPITSIVFGLSGGGFLTWPGHGGLPKTFDVTKQIWYEDGEHRKHGAWGRPHLDPHGLGLVLPYSVPLRSQTGEDLGVGALLVSIRHAVEQRMHSALLPREAQKWLVDERGDVVVEDTDSDKDVRVEGEDTGIPLDHDPLPIPQVRDEIMHKREGGVIELPNGDLAAFTRLDDLGWTYVVRGRSEQLLADTDAADE